MCFEPETWLTSHLLAKFNQITKIQINRDKITLWDVGPPDHPE